MLRVAIRASILAWLAAVSLALGSERSGDIRPLTTCDAVSHWTPTKDQPNYPVHLHAVVTYFDAIGRTMFVQDQTGGLFIAIPPKTPPVEAGQLLDLDGQAEVVDFSPQLNFASWTVLSRVPLPQALRVTFQQMASASEDSRFIEVDGIVREVAHLHVPGEQENLWMKVAINNNQVDIYLPWENIWPKDMVDAKVRIQGVSGAVFNAKNQQVGVQLYVPTLNQITVLAAATPSEPAPAPIGQLQRFGSRYFLGQRVKVAGTITAAIRGRGAYLQDASSGLYVASRQDISLRPGDRAEMLGFVEVFESHVQLADASVLSVSTGAAPQPLWLKADQAMTGQYDSELVSMSGRLVQSSVSARRTTLTLQQNQNIFSVSSLPGSSLGDLPADGSFLNVTGVLTDEIDSMGRVVQVNLLCRSPKDVVIVQRAPWWTLKKALAFVGVLALMAAVILIWVAVLRRRVNRQTEVIRQKLAEEEALKEAAQAASLAKSEFLANMSHEIRTPMNAIVGFTDLLFETPLNQEQQDFVDTLRTSSHSLMHLLNEILDFSKIEAGQLILEEVQFSLRETSRLAFQLIIPEAQRKGLQTLLNIAADVNDKLVGDPHRLQQVILNLLSNAIKFTSSGSVQLHVACLEQEGSTEILQFTIRDTGIGISAEAQRKIFEAFQQADGSMTRRYGGTGLGLAICTRLVGLLGGRIWVESKPQMGSEFHFTAKFKLPASNSEKLSPAVLAQSKVGA